MSLAAHLHDLCAPALVQHVVGAFDDFGSKASFGAKAKMLVSAFDADFENASRKFDGHDSINPKRGFAHFRDPPVNLVSGPEKLKSIKWFSINGGKP